MLDIEQRRVMTKKRKLGRPPRRDSRTKNVQVRVKQSEFGLLEQLAAKENTSRATIIYEALIKYLNELDDHTSD